MKKCFLIYAAALFILFAGCSIIGQKVSKPKEAAGQVTINFTLTRISGIASNQYAIWIEDDTGKFIRTLFVTDYMARRQGWKVREQTLITWVKATDLKNMSQGEIDAVSSPTPKAGVQTVVWDMKDASGKAVTSGTYVYKIEGSLFWANTELWTGKIKVGGSNQNSQAMVSYFPEGADKLEKVLISDVSASYNPYK